MTFIGSTFAQRVSVLVLVLAALVGIGALTASHGGSVLAGDVTTTTTTTTNSTPTTPPATPNGGNQDWV
ncbi:hypothetical protein ACGFX4_26415 [Kitasatospora sp. NPDC048365]|uniref:hypothetical protein n=1 Tax=Kitasatospora sp. NPDC048365 TaxID=3364050 RepID=UPI0037243525